MVKIRHMKKKIFFIAFVLAFIITLYHFLKVDETHENQLKIIANLKEDLGRDLFLNVKDEIDINVISKSVKRPKWDNFIDREVQHENIRRAKFDLYMKMKNIYVNDSFGKSVYSISDDKFITCKEEQLNWQSDIFGPSRPHLIKAINEIPPQLPEVANGYLGTQAFSDEVQIQSLFSGSDLDTRRASIPSWTIRNITSIFDSNNRNNVFGHRLELDMSNAQFLQVIYSSDCIVQQKIYAHQAMTSLLVHEIEVQFLNTKTEYVTLILPKGQKRDVSFNIQFIPGDTVLNYIRSIIGETHQNDKQNHQQKIYAIYHIIPNELKVIKSKIVQKFYYLMSINENSTLAHQHFKEGVALMENNNELFKNHTLTWKNMWSNNRLFMKVLSEIDVLLISAQYLLMINAPGFGREETYGAMGATGLGVLSNQGVGYSLKTNCNGRIEYTQELSMIGYQLIMHPKSVKSMLMKRILQLEMAKRNAKKFGFSGARFPTAANELGEELCPEVLCKHVHFPTGMVAIALKRYIMMTGDKSMFTEETGIALLLEINQFYMSVLNVSKKGHTILNSNGPSFLFGNVENSVFNLGLIKEVLLSFPVLVQFLNADGVLKYADYMSSLKNISDSIIIPFDNSIIYNPPNTKFQVLSDKLDVPEGVMLRYPLDSLVDRDTGTRNLEVYANRLVRNPDPFALSTLFIGEMESGNLASAYRRLDEITGFSNNRFKIWSNDSQLWIGSYIPAASSYLDSVLYGLIGLRIRKSGLYMKPQLLKFVSVVQLSSLTYHESVINITFDSKGIIIELVYRGPNAWPLAVMVVDKGTTNVLKDKLTFNLGTYLVIKRIKTP